jgi:Fe(3+) dicitrate transport protein
MTPSLFLGHQAARRPVLAATLLIGSSLLAAPSFAQQTNPDLNNLDIITVVGTVGNANDIPGAVTFIGADALAEQTYADINRVLRRVPGVNLQEEDGYGLRPNIGLRGSGADRSSKIVILEDGVLAAPAAYSAPAAYYFPVTGRMNAVEISKGPATIKYGPNTTAGAIQFFSTPIPQEPSGHIDLLLSDHNRLITHAWVGGRKAFNGFDLGALVETFQDRTDGFKELDTGDTGFVLQDYVVKLGAYLPNQSFELKLQSKDEDGDETYLGLSQADFDANPLRRYNASALDRMDNDRQTYQLTHTIGLGNDWDMTTIAYRTDFSRNWVKLDRFDNSQLSGNGACNSLDEILRDPLTCSQEFQVLEGAPGYVSPDDALQLRANNRTYYTQGIQSAVAGTVQIGTLTHNLTASLRYHEDEVDRFQDQDGYRIDNTALILTTDNAPGTQANRLSSAKALSAYLENRTEIGALSVTAGLRVEDVSTEQRRWNTPDRSLTPDSERDNDYTEWLPALSAIYDFDHGLSVLGGVHRGFSAPSVSSRQSTDAEQSTVWEAGFRYAPQGNSRPGNLRLEAIGFFNDYSNLLGECTNSAGGSECEIGDAFNAGEVDVYGLEATLDYAFTAGHIRIPVSATYTWTETEIKSTFADSFFGNVSAGDSLPYVPTHQFTLTVGLEGDSWGLDALLNTVSETRNIAGQGSVAADERIDARTIVDLSAYYQLSETVRLRVKAENLFDETYIAARRPYGLRPGKPRELFAGVSVDF